MSCTFPSKELVAERRQMVELADRTKERELMTACMEFVMQCDRLRLLHEEITGCGCWYKAINESKAVAA